MARRRLEEIVVSRGLAPTLELARRAIMAGEVFSGTRRLLRPGEAHPADLPLEHRPPDPWVGRGARKLLAALEAWPVAVAGRAALDLGASTGGFTQVLLERGARHVWAVDVGRGVLHARLRGDARVGVLEGTHARDLRAAALASAPPSLLVADLSFISLRAVLPAALGLLAEEAAGGAWRTPEAIVLVKPQFEAAAREVGRGGVVRDAAVRERIVASFAAWEPAPGWRCAGTIDSPIEGAAGNVEALAWYRAGEGGAAGGERAGQPAPS